MVRTPAALLGDGRPVGAGFGCGRSVPSIDDRSSAIADFQMSRFVSQLQVALQSFTAARPQMSALTTVEWVISTLYSGQPRGYRRSGRYLCKSDGE